MFPSDAGLPALVDSIVRRQPTPEKVGNVLEFAGGDKQYFAPKFEWYKLRKPYVSIQKLQPGDCFVFPAGKYVGVDQPAIFTGDYFWEAKRWVVLLTSCETQRGRVEAYPIPEDKNPWRDYSADPAWDREDIPGYGYKAQWQKWEDTRKVAVSCRFTFAEGAVVIHDYGHRIPLKQNVILL